MNTLNIYTDGGARGNPGPAGIGVVFKNGKDEAIHNHKEYIGEATNNQAEYAAIIKAIELVLKSKWFLENNKKEGSKIVCRLDSQLVVEQICGNYKVKNAGIIELMAQLKALLNQIEIPIEFIHIKREQNKLADKLVNQAIDFR